MVRSKKSSLENISIEDVNEIALEVSRLASASSKYIYIYSYSKSKSATLKKLVRAKEVASRSRKGGIIDTTSSKVNSKKRPFYASKGARQPRHKRFIPQRNTRWAIRIEGQADPLDRNFTSKETAIAFAKSLLKKGAGQTIIIV